MKALFLSTLATIALVVPGYPQDSTTLTAAQLHRLLQAGYSAAGGTFVAQTIWKGFDLTPLGSATEPREYLGDRVADWVRRHREADHALECNSLSARRAVCAYSMIGAPFSSLGPNAISTIVDFQDSSAYSVMVSYSVMSVAGAIVNATGGKGRSELDELNARTEELLTIIYGPPHDSTDLLSQSKTWKTPRSTVTRIVHVGAGGRYADEVTWAWTANAERREKR